MARTVHILGTEPGGYDLTYDLPWYECYRSYSECPSTKTTICLLEVFNLQPTWDLLTYTVGIGDDARARVQTYLESLPIKEAGFAVIHYGGNTSQSEKDLTHTDAKMICDWLAQQGIVVVLLDWDRRSSLADNRTVFNPDANNPLWLRTGTGDAETLAALFDRARLAVCIDSGPQKVCFSTKCPIVCPWVRHHPLHFADNAPHAIHVVPHDHAGLIRGDNREGALKFFDGNYKYVTYPAKMIAHATVHELAKLLDVPTPTAMPASYMLQSKAYDVNYYNEHRRAGLDYLGHGEWQEEYGRWIVEALGLRGKTVLDVGCACGSIACGLAKAGAFVSGIDLSEEMIRMGRERWLRNTLHVCDCVNLHLFEDATFSCLHSNQVAEHWLPHLVPHIFAELLRVTKPGGVFWCVTDTAESFEREGRQVGVNEDATHVCIKPLSWWKEQYEAAGWQDAPDLLAALKDHPRSYYRRYNWDSFACRKGEK